MKKSESEKLYKQWFPLVNHIILNRLAWAISDTGSGSFQRIRRAVDHSDLLSVGWIALQAAYNQYDKKHASGASFKTYAYRTIYNSLLNYLDANWTPITTASQRHIKRDCTPETKDKFQAATNYLCFSEIAHKNRRPASTSFEFVPVQPREAENTLDPAIQLEDYEFQEHCLAKLKSNLSAEEWRILMLRYSGKTFKEIGRLVSLSYEMVRKQLEALNFKVHHILYSEIQEFGHDDHTDTSLADYNATGS